MAKCPYKLGILLLLNLKSLINWIIILQLLSFCMVFIKRIISFLQTPRLTVKVQSIRMRVHIQNIGPSTVQKSSTEGYFICWSRRSWCSCRMESNCNTVGDSGLSYYEVHSVCFKQFSHSEAIYFKCLLKWCTKGFLSSIYSLFSVTNF